MDDVAPGRMMDVGDLRLHVVLSPEANDGSRPGQLSGARPLVVLLHGFPEFWYSWRHQIPALDAASFQVAAPDLRGYGLSDKPGGVSSYHIERLCSDVAGLVRALGYERACIVGHDWGGGVAWAFAGRHPEIVERLCVMNCPHPAIMARRVWRPRQLRRSWYMFFFQLPGLPERYVMREDTMRKALRGWAVHKDAFSDEDLEKYVEAIRRPGAATSAINYYRAAFRRLPFKARPIDCPTLLIWGDRDRALGQELIPGTESIAPRLTVRHIPDASHWVQQDCPGEVNALLVPFLKGAAA